MVQSALLQISDFFAKAYHVNYFVGETRKHGTDFSINFHYDCLLLLMSVKRYTTANLKICRHIYLHINHILKVLH